MSINFATLQRLKIPEGVVTQIVDQYGNILMSAGGWTKDLDTGLEFKSTSQFSIKTPSRRQWDGIIEYCNSENGWRTAGSNSNMTAGKFRGKYYLYIRGRSNTKITGAENTGYAWTISVQNPDAGVECNGNIENLLDYLTVKSGQHPRMANYCFTYLFYRWTNLITAPSLPATTLTLRCYNRMFQECSRLTNPPELPSTSIAESCYDMMFFGCTSLATAPRLPATTLAKNCYWGMFNGCTSLELPPSLPATTIAYGCYQNMFIGCANLIGLPTLPATTLQQYCYYRMFYNCQKIKLNTSNTIDYPTEYRIPSAGTATTNYSNSVSGMFTNLPFNINTTYYLHSSNIIV